MDKKCYFCDNLNCHYICPKCGIFYCSLKCYQNQQHLNCTELFYKDQVLLHLSTYPNQSELKQKTLKLLQKLNLNDEFDNDDNFLHDERKEISTNAQLLSNDVEDLETLLTQEEKQTFEKMAQSGSIFNLLPSSFWDPWYYKYTKTLIQSIEDKEKKEEIEEDKDIPKSPNFDINHLKKFIQNASPLIKFNIINTILSYCYICRLFTNDHILNANEAYSTLIEISILSEKNIVCDNCSYALQITCRRLIEHKSSPICFIRQLLIDTAYIIQTGNDLILRVLNDLIELISKVKKNLNSNQTNPKALVKKIQFYIAWSKMHQDELKKETRNINFEIITSVDHQKLHNEKLI